MSCQRKGEPVKKGLHKIFSMQSRSLQKRREVCRQVKMSEKLERKPAGSFTYRFYLYCPRAYNVSIQILGDKCFYLRIRRTGSIEGDDLSFAVKKHETGNNIDIIQVTEILFPKLLPLRLIPGQFV